MAANIYTAREQARWMKPNAALWVRPDAARFFKPGINLADVFPALALKYNPNQPRVPSGNPDGGQWTDGEGSGRPRVIIDTTHWDQAASGHGADQGDRQESGRPDDKRYDTRLASNDDRPQLGKRGQIAIVAEIGRRLIRAFRSENILFDLFGRDTGAVAHTKLDDIDVFGTDSSSQLYTSKDRAAANEMRARLIEKYPDIFSSDNIGHAPNNALYHAETNLLLRSGKQNGGSLAGRELDIYVDRNFCDNCRTVVPLVGLEPGNPTITVIDPVRSYLIKDGVIISRMNR